MVLIWEPITDLPHNWQELTDGELGPLLQFWTDQRADVEQGGALAEFSARLAREWSIETGQIEGVYELDRGITQTLIERGIDADLIGNHPGQKPPELIAAIIQDHAEVLEGLFQIVKGDRPLTKGYIHELHAGLLRHQETTMVMDQFGHLFESQLAKGKYKERPNNPKKPDGSMHQYCPPEQVDTEMDRLLALHAEHEKRGVPVEMESAWLHHRFTQIHPYQHGNGRVARALASLIFIKAGWFPVVVTRDERARYIDALEVADQGDLEAMVSFFVYQQKHALFEAVQSAAELRTIANVDDAIKAAKRVLRSRGKESEPAIWLRTRKIADALMELTYGRLSELENTLRNEIDGTGVGLTFEATTHGFNSVSVEHLPYKPNKVDYQNGAAIIIHKKSYQDFSEIEVQAHAIGSKFRGLIGFVVAFQNNERLVSNASSEPFQVNYSEPYENAERRFRAWLEESLVNALTLWRKSL